MGLLYIQKIDLPNNVYFNDESVHDGFICHARGQIIDICNVNIFRSDFIIILK